MANEAYPGDHINLSEYDIERIKRFGVRLAEAPDKPLYIFDEREEPKTQSVVSRLKWPPIRLVPK